MKDLFGNDISEGKSLQRRDWTGNSISVYKSLGASNHCDEERASNDYYATAPEAVELLCQIETFSPHVWEPCCGQGHVSRVLASHGYSVRSTDLVDRGFGNGGIDFLQCTEEGIDCDIVTNPPYSMAQEFVEKSLNVVGDGHKVAMFLKLTFAEGQARRSLFHLLPPLRIWVSSRRLECGKNGVFGKGSAVAYAWFVWQKGFTGETTLKWFN